VFSAANLRLTWQGYIQVVIQHQTQLQKQTQVIAKVGKQINPETKYAKLLNMF
jgi:hypothetical protein